MAAVHEPVAADLGPEFRGEVIRPGHERYDVSRSLFNAMFDRRPEVIARCTGVADVVAALRYAREHDLIVAVRGGGHGVAGYAVCDDGIVIDVGPMKGVRVDPAARTVVAQAGVTWGEFDRETQLFALATTGGRMTTTGIAGLTLGSGSGWLERKFGLVADNVLSVDVVTADGRVVTASERENEDLFWGLRGGGGNFGIATAFEYRLHELGPIVLGGMLLYRREQAREVLRGWRDLILEAPDELGGAFVFLTAPPLPFVPEDLQGQPAAAIVVVYAGPPDEGARAVQGIRELAPPAADLVQPMPYTVLQTLIDPPNQPGRHNYWKSENVRELSDAAVDALAEGADRMRSPFSIVLLEAKGGALARVAEDAMALGSRHVPFTYYGIAMWEDPTETETHVAWAREFGEAMAPHTTSGVYLNFTSEHGDERVRSTFGEDKYRRLVALKNEYDPDNVFRLNANIVPNVGIGTTPVV